MAPPHRGHRSAERYKSFIDARVPGKDNSYREDHPDQGKTIVIAVVDGGPDWNVGLLQMPCSSCDSGVIATSIC